MNLIVSPAPHIKTRRTTRTIMLDVLIALLPASAAGIVFFGWEAAVFIAISLAGAFLTELVWYLIQHKVWTDSGILKDFFRQFDLTSLVTGLLLALCLPAQIEAWYMPLIGSIFAVGVAKMLFGGTGKNIVNPALAGRIMLFISFTAMTMYPAANLGPIATDAANFDPSAGSTQLGNFLSGQPMLSALDLFLGTGVAGCIGETCKLALLVGYLYLCVRGVIKWYLPLLYIVTTGLFAMALEGGFGINLFAEAIFSGGLFLGAIFMATDYVTTPKTTLGNIIYFIALGLFTAGLRKAVGIEVVSFAIFLMNFVVFLLDLVIRPRPFGSVKTRRAKQ